ncbi:MAG: type I glyceraldehyde-3-phosphate dehydrogenase [bacterium]|nr:type I glyceraldehyde-3-phosphate dehydrogenase [bacterium]
MTRIAINGFGRIGMLTAQRMQEKHPNLELVAINEVNPVEKQAFNRARFFSEKDPSNLPWKDLEVDTVLECSGFFTELNAAKKHLLAGAKKVIISAPSDSPEIPVFLLGVNAQNYKGEAIISMGSCTTNAVAPLAKILDANFGVKNGFVNTVHSYTNSQNKLYPNWRQEPASKLSIIPSTTGATKTIEKCLPKLKGKLNGLSLRVPTETVSIVEFVFLAKKKATVEQVNAVLQRAAEEFQGTRFLERGFKEPSALKSPSNILKFENKKLISTDLKNSEYSSIIDGSLTQTFGKLIKVFAWYDNEWGYICRLAEMAEYIGGKN